MDAAAFRHFYAYHFAENRTMWDNYIVPLAEDQFIQHVDYSIGSIRNQIVHLMHVDQIWFSQLRGIDLLELPEPDAYKDRSAIRAHWDQVETDMHSYLNGLKDSMLFEKPFAEGEDKDLILWQVLLHVVNHGTDHRAQILRLLSDMGVKTTSQDYVFYVYDHP